MIVYTAVRLSVRPSPFPHTSHATTTKLSPPKNRGENAQDYTVGVRGVASVTKGHHKMLFSLVFTNTVWVEKVRVYVLGRSVGRLVGRLACGSCGRALAHRHHLLLRTKPPPTKYKPTNKPVKNKQVAFDAQGREWDDDSLYWSDFSEYPEDVQDAFTGYLAER